MSRARTICRGGLLGAALLCLATGSVWAAPPLLIVVKAWAAPILNAYAFGDGTAPGRPWPWADWRVVARLEVAGATHFVLDSASMRALAFGPVMARSGEAMILHGHNDTHFRSLASLAAGEVVHLWQAGSAPNLYRVTHIWEAEAGELYIPGAGAEPGLLLVTCSAAGSDGDEQETDRRRLVWAEPVFASGAREPEPATLASGG